MTSTMQALTDRSDRPEDLIAAGEVLDLRFRDHDRALSLRAGKLFHLLVAHAGAAALDDVEHAVSIASLNFSHAERGELVECIRDLVSTTVELRVKGKGPKGTVMIDPLLYGIRRPEDMDDDNGTVYYRLSPTLRKVLEQSNHWAALSRKAVLAFESRYALRLYEIVALRINLDRVSSEVFELPDLRRRFGVQARTFKLWNDFRRFVLERAIAEVNQLSGFHVEYEAIKKGRAFAAVKLSWSVQGVDGRAAVARELEASAVGRQARREEPGQVVTVMTAPSPPGMATGPTTGFPETGSVSFGPWGQHIRQFAPKPTPDVDVVANDFRAFCARKGIPLDGPTIGRTLMGFVRKWTSSDR